MPEPISDSAIAAQLRRQMTIAAAKELVAAGNLANLNTPGYRALETFEAALESASGETGPVMALATTDSRHLPLGGGSHGVPTREAEGLAERRDGNTVQLDRELLNMTTASGQFKAAQTALAAKFRLVRYALSEGR
jgi:flagellar basal-body rod protein FlgB